MSLVSIIVPVYNTASDLLRCLESIRGQTLHNLKVLLIDDGSTDGSGAICDRFAAADSRFRVFHQVNAGASAARNNGLRHASGDWIGFADSDDWMELDTFAYLLEQGEAAGADIVQCGLFFEYGSRTETRFTMPKTYTAGAAKTFTAADWRHFSNQVYNKLYRRKILGGVAFDSRYIVGEDFVFNLDAVQRAARVTFCAAPKYHYLQRADSLCHRVRSSEELFSYRRALLDALRRDDLGGCADGHFRALLLENNLDICRKAALLDDLDALSIRAELNRVFAENRAALRRRGWTLKAKTLVKLFLTGHLWPIYRAFVRKKGRGGQ